MSAQRGTADARPSDRDMGENHETDPTKTRDHHPLRDRVCRHVSSRRLRASNRWREFFRRPVPRTAEDSVRRHRSCRHVPLSSGWQVQGALRCTAAIVLDARIILTAAHCVVRDNRASGPTHFYFEAAHHAGAVLDRIEAKVWAIGAGQASQQQSIHDVSNDWAILVLEHAPATAVPLRLGPSGLEPLNSYEHRLLLPSYSIDNSDIWAPTVDAGCSPHNPIGGVLIHDCKASYGSSGAPLLIRDRDWYAVVGIHTGSIFAADDEGRVAGLIGNTAVGVQAFSDAMQVLVQRLNRGDNVYGAGSRLY